MIEKKIVVEAEPNSIYEHISVLLAGLYMLEDKIELHIKDNSHKKGFIYSYEAGLELIINGKKCYLDVSDGYNNLNYMKKNCKNYYMYFKRSYDKKINKDNGLYNVFPLGLNYEVYDKRIKYRFNNQKILKKIFANSIGKKVFNQYYLEDYEYNGIYNIDNPKICFLTRLWKGKENNVLNNTRIELVRELKKKYGNRFFGGIYRDELSLKKCPELTISKFYTYKKKYLEMMHKCDICISTNGLHNSIGWKFAEYVIAGKVIISEKPIYYIPNNFKEDKNYISFDSIQDCINKIDELLRDRKKLLSISYNNINYYKKYLRPDMMILRVINMVLANNR